jgi:general secretion pathway protein F/type IV pilus assembly protein PilC
MTTFNYIAREPGGQQVTGTLIAPNEQAVLAELQGRELAPLRIRPVRERAHWQRRVSTRQLATAYRQVADLLRVGMPLLRSLQLLSRNKSNPHLASAMGGVADEIAQGARLADAMARHHDVFAPIQVAMIRAGERGSFLDEVFGRLGDFLERQADLRAKVVGSMIYPAVLLTVGLGIVIAALVFFVPKFQDFFGRIALPLPTKILLGTSAILTRHWLVLVVAFVAVALGYSWIRRRPDVRRAVERWQLRIPKLGPLISSLAVARFTRTFGTLLGNGVPTLSAMQISRDAVGHSLLAEAVDRAAEAVRAGESLAPPLGQSGIFPEEIIEMIAVGESANNLPGVLTSIADTIEKRVDRMLNIFVRLMEPFLLLCLAGVVLFIFIALIVPMMRMSSAIGG